MNNILKDIAYTLMIIGAVNWGLVGMLDFDLVAFLFGEMSLLSRIVYSLVGISAVYALFSIRACHRIENPL